jgi:hypothetical protein
LAVERQVRALELRAKGHTFRQIAAAIGYTNRQGAHNAVRRALTRVAAKAPNHVELCLELERVDSLFFPTFAAALDGNLSAVELCVALLMRKAALTGQLNVNESRSRRIQQTNHLR